MIGKTAIKSFNSGLAKLYTLRPGALWGSGAQTGERALNQVFSSGRRGSAQTKGVVGMLIPRDQRVVHMERQSLEKERIALENTLTSRRLDFVATHMAVGNLHPLVQRHPEVIHENTIAALESLLREGSFCSETQSFFFYREAAHVLASIVTRTREALFADEAISALRNVLETGTGDPKRASAEALGSLPVAIYGPETKAESLEDVPPITWPGILEANNVRTQNPPAIMGRSLVLSMDGEDRLFVLKVASGEKPAAFIHREALWMDHLHSERYSFPVRFNIPKALKIDGSYLFRLEGLPVQMGRIIDRDSALYAICFLAHSDYFTYPNDYRTERQLSEEEFRRIMSRNAWLLGALTYLGIVHSAPIPLFHNRIQRNRRADHGHYEWPRGGRLDRWLDSCSYPNFGATGIRDFEHLVAFRGRSRELYAHIGTQILSLQLVAGSYFRNKDRTRIGWDDDGNAWDARDLFDKQLLEEVIRETFLNYYHGFVGKQFLGALGFNCHALASRMIEEMGVDRHMEEVLRVVDQREMTDEAFRDFLAGRGYSQEGMQGFRRGVEDIIVLSGPHLGGFNERISLPELIESVGAMAALCMVGRYREETSPS